MSANSRLIPFLPAVAVAVGFSWKPTVEAAGLKGFSDNGFPKVDRPFSFKKIVDLYGEGSPRSLLDAERLKMLIQMGVLPKGTKPGTLRYELKLSGWDVGPALGSKVDLSGTTGYGSVIDRAIRYGEYFELAILLIGQDNVFSEEQVVELLNTDLETIPKFDVEYLGRLLQRDDAQKIIHEMCTPNFHNYRMRHPYRYKAEDCEKAVEYRKAYRKHVLFNRSAWDQHYFHDAALEEFDSLIIHCLADNNFEAFIAAENAACLDHFDPVAVLDHMVALCIREGASPQQLASFIGLLCGEPKTFIQSIVVLNSKNQPSQMASAALAHPFQYAWFLKVLDRSMYDFEGIHGVSVKKQVGFFSAVAKYLYPFELFPNSKVATSLVFAQRSKAEPGPSSTCNPPGV